MPRTHQISATVLAFLVLLAPKSFAGTVKWGCLIDGVIGNKAGGFIFSHAQLIQLTIKKDKVISGSVRFHNGGEACLLPVKGGSMSVNGRGVGRLSVLLDTSGQDTDGDFSCDAVIGLPDNTNSITENFDLVLAAGLKQVFLANGDEFLTGAGAVNLYDLGSGRCLKQ